METKKWYLSKTLWINAIALITALLADIDAELSTMIIGILNIILRFFTNKQIIK